MKQGLLLIAVLAICLAPAAEAYEVLVVQGSRIPPYEEARQGFESVLAGMAPARGPRSVCLGTVTEIVLSENPNNGQLSARIRELNPDLILAIGGDALWQVREFRNKPIVYLMVPCCKALRMTQPNITGVDLVIPAAKQVAALIEAFPGIRRVGLLYDPERTEALAEEAGNAAEESGLSPVAEKVRTAADVPAGIFFAMAAQIDAFWLLPDLTVITPATLAALSLCAYEEHLPILAFADKYLRHGAALSISFDVYEMGRQAGGMARRILAGTKVNKVPVEPPLKIKVTANPRLMKTLRAAWDEDG